MNSDSFTFGGEIVWRPSPEYVDRSHTRRLMSIHGIDSFDELLERSTADVAWFTDAIFKYLDIRFQQPYTQVVDHSRGVQWPEWCVGGRMNIAESCLDKHLGCDAESRTALIWEGEEGETRSLTYRELADDVGRCANALRSLGLGKGDQIGIFMPMTPEIAIALLAVAKIGGIVPPPFSGYGPRPVASRPRGGKTLFSPDGFYRPGEMVPPKPVPGEARARIPALQ